MKGDKGHRRAVQRPSGLERSRDHQLECFWAWHGKPTSEEQVEYDIAFHSYLAEELTPISEPVRHVTIHSTRRNTYVDGVKL
jgi:hypothetical protein